MKNSKGHYPVYNKLETSKAKKLMKEMKETGRTLIVHSSIPS